MIIYVGLTIGEFMNECYLPKEMRRVIKEPLVTMTHLRTVLKKLVLVLSSFQKGANIEAKQHLFQ